MCGWVHCLIEVNNDIAVIGMKPYDVYLVFQSLGRLIPGWGHAGQNTAIDPSLGWASSWCARPLCILFWRSRHWRDALRSCLYRFCHGTSVHRTLHWKRMWSYWDASREHSIGYALELWIVLLCCGLALQIVCQKVIQNWEGEGSFYLLVAWRKEPRLDQLLISMHCVGAYAV